MNSNSGESLALQEEDTIESGRNRMGDKLILILILALCFLIFILIASWRRAKASCFRKSDAIKDRQETSNSTDIGFDEELWREKFPSIPADEWKLLEVNQVGRSWCAAFYPSFFRAGVTWRISLRN